MSPEIKAIERRVALLQVKEQTITDSIELLMAQRHAVGTDILRLSDIKQEKMMEIRQLSWECE